MFVSEHLSTFWHIKHNFHQDKLFALLFIIVKHDSDSLSYFVQNLMFRLSLILFKYDHPSSSTFVFPQRYTLSNLNTQRHLSVEQIQRSTESSMFIKLMLPFIDLMFEVSYLQQYECL